MARSYNLWTLLLSRKKAILKSLEVYGVYTSIKLIPITLVDKNIVY